MRNLLIAQSGGPTAAINATLMGIVSRAFVSDCVDKIYGGINGIKGILDENIKEIGPLLENTERMALLSLTPAAALGTCRFKLDGTPETYKKILGIFRKFEISYFIYIGGNDSMDTAHKLSRYFIENGAGDIKVAGCPKTIDNDLCVTDHTPGFGTAAKYIAVAVAEIFRDVKVYDFPQVIIVETMGRDTGWLAASSSLAGINGADAPHLIYIPEVVFDNEKFISDIKYQMSKSSYVMVVVSEGVKDASGEYLCEKEESRSTDCFGHKFLSGAGKYLERLVVNHIGCKVRTIDFSLLQRCSAHVASLTDIEESRLLGAAALDSAINGESGEMPYIERLSDEPYSIKIRKTSMHNIANLVKRVPLEWLNEERNNVSEKMISYLKPLIQGECHHRYNNGVPEHLSLY